ncbi:serine protease [Photobacterium sp. WH77]|uniref:S1 family peptidase n=1 Tax=Photobacterium TaxID=657 RepID=UPI001EDBCCA0|nr:MULTISPECIES: serine protease [Photobacterium]MCG2837752.1 serine protease [Photobacterium sp. WH77]MCG2845368.1 serine protease [Photobacterium sp. WH80]
MLFCTRRVTLCIVRTLFCLGCILLTTTHTQAALPDVIAKIKPSVVGVGTYNKLATPRANLIGTGFVVGDGTLIATNNHVVPTSIEVDTNTGFVVFVGTGTSPDVRTATVVARDSEHDLALLKITGSPLPSLRLSPRPVREGEIYSFTGFPIGAVLGLYPVTHRGMVSSITPIAVPARTAKELSVARLKYLKNPYVVYQFDATAYPGNSGSPVYHQDTGEVIAVINKVLVQTSKENALSQPSAITYAIPVRHLNQLLSSRYKP